MAAGRTRNIILKITGDERDAKRAAQSVREELRRLSREDVKARIDLDTRILKTKIAKVEADLDKLGSRNPSPEVDLKTQKALRKLDRLNIALDRMKLKRVSVDIDVKRGGLERATAALGSLDRGGDKFFKGIGDFFRSIPVLGQMLGTLIDGFVEFGNTIASGVGKGVTALAGMVPGLTGLAAPLGAAAGSAINLALSLGSMVVFGAALIVALNAVIGVVVALTGALVALAASAAAAVGGLAALAVGFGAALLPALIVGIALMTRFVAILKARQAQQQEVSKATQAAKTAEEAHNRALQQRKQAEEQLASATVAGRQAAAQAIRDERDAELGLLNAKNGVADTRLQLALAKRDLKDFLKGANVKGGLNGLLSQATDVHADPGQLQSILGKVSPGASGKKIDPLDLRQKLQAVRDAQLGVMNATNNVTQSEERLASARSKEADFATRGLRAYGPYRTALSAVSRANLAVAKSAQQKTAAETKYEQALRKLTPTERTALGNLDKFMAAFTKLAKAVSDPVFKALNDVWTSLSKSGLDVSGALTQIGRAFGDSIRAFGVFLVDPRTQSAFKVMAAGAADLIRQLGGRAFKSFLDIMREVALTALPAVRDAARGVADWLGRIAAQPKRIHSVVGELVAQFKTWARFAGAVAKLVIALFSAAAPAGKSLAEHMTTIVNKWTSWINNNPSKVTKFFKDAVQKTRDIAGWIKNAVVWLRDHLPGAAKKAKSTLEEVFKVVKAIADKLNQAIKGWTDLKNLVAPGSNKLTTGASSIQTDMTIVNREASLLKKHLTPEERQGARQRLADALKDIKDQGGTLGTGPLAALLSRLEKLGFDKGGLVPGTGATPATVHGGEFVLRKGIVNTLGLPLLNALNSGSPEAAMAATGGGGAIHNYYVTVRGNGSPDPREFIESVHRIVQTKG